MSDQNVFTPKPAKKPNSRIITGVIIIAVIAALLSTSFYTVNANQKAVVTRFGRFRSTEDEGLHFKLPLGIDKVYKVTQTVQAKQFGFRTLQAGVSTTYDQKDYTSESEMLTGDLNIVDVTWIIEYRITDPRAWLFNVDNSRIYGYRTEDNRDKTIRDITQSVMNRLVGDRAILDVMSSERDAIEYEAKKDIQDRLNHYSLGVSITQVKMQQVIPPKGEVQDAFEDVNKAIQDRNRLINEGEQAYYAEIPKIEGQAKQMIAEAEGYKQSRINKAKGEVALFNAIYEQYKKAPEVTRQRLYYETLNAVLKDNKNTEIVGKDVNNFLPLKNIGGGAGE